MKIKTADLIGAKLDYATAKAVFSIEPGDHETADRWYTYRPSTNWTLAGPIIEREKLWLMHGPDLRGTERWSASTHGTSGVGAVGPTALIAAMRCYVASKLGDEVEIPDELT